MICFSCGHSVIAVFPVSRGAWEALVESGKKEGIYIYILYDYML